MSFMLSVANKPIMLSVVVLNVVVLNVVVLNVFVLNVVVLNVIELNVVMLGVVSPLAYYINSLFSVHYESIVFYSIVPGLFKYFVQLKKIFQCIFAKYDNG